jgi:esterase/lipase
MNILSAAASSSLFASSATTLEDLRQREALHGIKEEERTQVFAPREKIIGVALVMHGLNQKPMRMNEFSDALAENGILAVRSVLSGHGGENNRFKTMTREQWLSDTFSAYLFARSLAEKHGTPLHAVGFSLGALQLTDLATSPEFPQVRFRKAVFLAPAMTPSLFSTTVKLLTPFPFLSIPSGNRADNRSQFLTPITAYKALFQSVDIISARSPKSINFQALVFISPKDELVSFSGIQKFSESTPEAARWKIRPISRGEDAPLKDHYHSIFESRFLGKKNWDAMISESVSFLTQGSAYKN